MISEYIFGPNDSIDTDAEPDEEHELCDCCGICLYSGDLRHDFPGETVCDDCVTNMTVYDVLKRLDIGKRWDSAGHYW